MVTDSSNPVQTSTNNYTILDNGPNRDAYVINNATCGTYGLTINPLATPIYQNSFDTSNGITLSGDAVRETPANQIKLVPDQNNKNGKVIINNLPATLPSNFEVNWRFFHIQKDGADGYSFNLGNDSFPGAFEDGTNQGLAVKFKIYQQDQVSIKWNGTEIVAPVNTTLELGRWIDAKLMVVAGKVTLYVNGKQIANEVTIPGFTQNNAYKIIFAARTGGSSNATVIDDVTFGDLSTFEYSIDGTTFQTSNVFSNITLPTDRTLPIWLKQNGCSRKVRDYVYPSVEPIGINVAPSSSCNPTAINISYPSSLQNAAFYINDFSTKDGYVIGGSTTKTTGGILLTKNESDNEGYLLINKPEAFDKNGFAFTFIHKTATTNGADGFSFNLGNATPIVNNTVDYENGVTTGLAVRFKTFGTDNLQVYYNGTQLTMAGQPAITIETGNAETYIVRVKNNILDIYQGNVIKFTTTLPVAYATDDFANHQFIVAARTGGSSNENLISVVNIDNTQVLQGSIDNVTFTDISDTEETALPLMLSQIVDNKTKVYFKVKNGCNFTTFTELTTNKSASAPTGTSSQNYTEGTAKFEDLTMTTESGYILRWYTSPAGALSGTYSSSLAPTALIPNGSTTVYAVAFPTFSTTCRSASTEVTLTAITPSSIVLAQIGNEGDVPNTVTSVVTVAQLGQIVPAINFVEAANQTAYQAYIDANPTLFSAPATAAEVQDMVITVNGQVAAQANSNAVLTQIGNEGDAPNTVTSVVTPTQLGQILPAITGVIAANVTAYQAYIDANPNLFSAPATAAEVQAMITAVNAAASATIFYVDASRADNSGDGLTWATAKKDIQNAIDIANTGGQVRVKSGVYYPNSSPNMSASTPVTASTPLTSRDYYIKLKDGVSVYGGFSGTETALNQRNIADNPTYIDGDIGVAGDKSDNCYHLMIYVGNNTTTGVTVDGFVLRNANATRLPASTDIFESTFITANGIDNYIQRRLAGGIYVLRGLNSYFNNIVFENNECENRGAGIFLDGGTNLTSSFYVTNCYFVNNHISQGTYGAMSSFYGKIYCYNTVFHNNSVGNLQYGEGVALTLIRSQNKVVNCTFTNNQSYSGSALYYTPTSATSTVTTEIYNSIFYGTTRNPSFAGTSGYDIKGDYDSYLITVSNCSLIHPSTTYNATNLTPLNAASSGNIYQQTPVFSNLNNIKGVDGKYFTSDDGLALMTTSPEKNTGLNSLIPSTVTTDITGANRIMTTTVDMGAYEIDGAVNPSNAVLAQIGNEGDAPNTVTSVVTVAQLGQILPAITGIVAANQTAYQAYIDANPNSFASPATATEVQAMVTAVNAQVAAQAASNAVLTQIGNEGDAPNTVTSVVTVAQLGQILPAITGIVAANQAAYQAYIDANPALFASPATAAEVQAMVTAVNTQVAAQAASNAVLTQIGNEGDAPNTVTSVVTVAQLGQIIPAITGIVAANQTAYQAYIDANPALFSAPATAAEVQAMVTAVNAQVAAQAASNAVLTQIGNEGDAPNTVTSAVTTAQLGQILPAITGIVAANQTAYQAYIDANPTMFSAPATAAEVQAMVTAVNAQVSAQAASNAVLTQIGNEGDAPNTVISVVTVAQLGQILPAITGIVAANQAAYQAYIDANPALFASPATATQVQAMVTAVNAQAASNAVLTQLGNEGDAPNTVPSTVTVAQLGQILPAITGVVAANQTAYQTYIDSNPTMFSAPATAAEVQAMVTAVNAQVAEQAASNAVLTQIGNEADEPSDLPEVPSVVTTVQLGAILPVITGIITANEVAYQAYIDANPTMFSAPATAAEVQAMITAVNATLLSTSSFDKQSVIIYPNPSSAIFNIEIGTNATFELFDLSGKSLQSDTISVGTTVLDLSNYANGVYLIKILNEINQTKTVRIIKQ